MVKFRSMRTDAEEVKKRLMEQNEGNGVLFKMKDDPRITPIGKFIRKYSIDELPQLWNVFIGDMSLVGPRPPLVEEVEQYEDIAYRRLLVKPGITGLWQVVVISPGKSRFVWISTMLRTGRLPVTSLFFCVLSVRCLLRKARTKKDGGSFSRWFVCRFLVMLSRHRQLGIVH